MHPNTYAMAFSPDGQSLAVGGADGFVRIWEADRVGQDLRGPPRLRCHTGAVRAVAFSPDGRWLYTAGDGTIRRCDLARPEFLQDFGLGSGDVVGPTGRGLEVRAKEPVDETPALVAEGGGPELLTVPVQARGDNGELARSADRRAVVRCAWVASKPQNPVREQTALVADAATGAVRCRLVGHTKPLAAAAFSPDGTRVVTAAEDRTVRVWDAATGQELLRLPHPGPELLGPGYHSVRLAFTADGRRLAFVSGSRVRLWSVAGTSAERQTLQQARGQWWHLQQAEEAVEGRDRFAALWHLRFCDGTDPEPPQLGTVRRRARELPAP
jgi:WD40 repeat protein